MVHMRADDGPDDDGVVEEKLQHAEAGVCSSHLDVLCPENMGIFG